VSRYGLIAYANSLEQIGPIAPSVEEAAELLEVIAGQDAHDATTREAPRASEKRAGDAREQREAPDGGDYAAAADGDVDGLDIGVPTELLDGADDDVVETFWDAIADLEAQGASYHEVSMESLEHAVEAYYVIAMSEASSNLARFDGVRYGPTPEYEGNWNEEFAKVREEGFGEEVKRRILLGTYALSAGYHDKYYKQAQDARAWIWRTSRLSRCPQVKPTADCPLGYRSSGRRSARKRLFGPAVRWHSIASEWNERALFPHVFATSGARSRARTPEEEKVVDDYSGR
jgi:aspartyl-tRNA(Asn)/glutamyl-tRNA(Gln) amidotransferase subunit A